MQQPTQYVKNLADYNTVFKKTITPHNQGDHRYYDASNIGFVDNVDKIETTIIVVDSMSRNWDKDSSDNYTVNLGDTFHYVHSIELMDGYVPASGYVINATNNTIHFKESTDGDLISASIEPGNYTIDKLLELLSDAMNESSTEHRTYTCVAHSHTNKVTIKSNKKFNLIFTDGKESVGDRGVMETLLTNPVSGKKELTMVETGNFRQQYIKSSIGKVLGFKPINLNHSEKFTGQMVYDLRQQKYLGIFVNTENADDFKKIVAPSPDNGVNGAFAIVTLDQTNESYNIKYNQVIDNGRFIKTFNPPIHFNKLRIEYRTTDGNLYDFNGLENHLVFEVKKLFGREMVSSLKNLK